MPSLQRLNSNLEPEPTYILSNLLVSYFLDGYNGQYSEELHKGMRGSKFVDAVLSSPKENRWHKILP